MANPLPQWNDALALPGVVAVPSGGLRLPTIDLTGKPPRLLPTLPALPGLGGAFDFGPVTLKSFSADDIAGDMRNALTERVLQGAAKAAGLDTIEVGAWQRIGILAGGITVGTLSILAGIAIMAK